MNNQGLFATEYLIVLDKTSVKAYYNLINKREMFDRLIKNEAGIEIKNNKITYQKKSYEYKVRHGEVNGKEQRYFYVSISTNSEEFDEYSKLLRQIKTVFFEQGFIVETLRDDISFYYSKHAYSMIHEIENLMRKFIAFFMITNVGKDWVSDSIPEQVKAAIKKCKPREYASELQKLDFKVLGSLLFDEYQNQSNTSLHRKIASYKGINEVVLEDLRSFVPKSNWDRYFKKHINYEGAALAKKWEKLYELRNSVAHTSSLSRINFDDIKELVEDVKPVLQEAFETLGNLNLDTSERLAISQSVATKLDTEVASYFSKVNSIEEEIRSLAPEKSDMSIENLLVYLKDNSFIEEVTYNKILKLIELKGSVSFDSKASSKSINNLAAEIDELQESIQDTWSKEVYFALKELGGKSKLDDIYLKVQQNTKRRLFGSWKTSVRRAIYNNSSDVELYNGKYDIYEQVSKGVWMIRKDLSSSLLVNFLEGESG